jgi:hypothetical protein
MIKLQINSSQGNSANTLLATVAPTPNVSTLAQALDCGMQSARLGHGCEFEAELFVNLKSSIQ